MANLITFDSLGLHRANFLEIKTALIEEFKNIYGSDIDVSTASADGVYINTLGLLLDNVLGAVNALYTQLDINSATGTNLDALCALTNVFRQQATFSRASISVTNVGPTSVTLLDPRFVDVESNTWKYDGTLTLAPSETQQIIVTCERLGAVKAPAGSINQTLTTSTLLVTQTEPAIVGKDKESDMSLRARRAQSSKISANTVIEALQAALLEIDGIDDVFVYNNNTGTSFNAADGTSIDAHSIYVIIRRNPLINVTNETIGQLIHKKLTPGIRTIQSNGTAGLAKSYQYSEKLYNTYIADSEQNIYWKEAQGYAPQITFNITVNSYFRLPSSNDDREVKEIAESMMTWLASLSIGDTVSNNSARLMSQLYAVDPRYNGLPTYSINSASISSSIKPDTFYEYGEYEWTHVSDNIYTFTLKTSI